MNHTTAQTDDYKLAQRYRNDPQGTDITTNHGECMEGMRWDCKGPTVIVLPDDTSVGFTFDQTVLGLKPNGLISLMWRTY